MLSNTNLNVTGDIVPLCSTE